jgi:DNA topoisomerase-1
MANTTFSTAISNERISKDEDKAMDKQVPSNGHVEPGISIRMGPVDEMDVDAPSTNGAANGKRKARNSITNTKSYKDASSSEEDDKPLVRCLENHDSDDVLTCLRASGDGLPSRPRL